MLHINFLDNFFFSTLLCFSMVLPVLLELVPQISIFPLNMVTAFAVCHCSFHTDTDRTFRINNVSIILSSPSSFSLPHSLYFFFVAFSSSLLLSLSLFFFSLIFPPVLLSLPLFVFLPLTFFLFSSLFSPSLCICLCPLPF